MMIKTVKDFGSFKSKQYDSKTYFDKECYEQKLLLRKCLRKYKRNGNDENKNAYAQCRKNYKCFLRDKQQAFNKLKVQSLLKNFKNSKLFWQEINAITVK